MSDSRNIGMTAGGRQIMDNHNTEFSISDSYSKMVLKNELIT